MSSMLHVLHMHEPMDVMLMEPKNKFEDGSAVKLSRRMLTDTSVIAELSCTWDLRKLSTQLLPCGLRLLGVTLEPCTCLPCLNIMLRDHLARASV